MATTAATCACSRMRIIACAAATELEGFPASSCSASYPTCAGGMMLLGAADEWYHLAFSGLSAWTDHLRLVAWFNLWWYRLA